MSASSCRRTNVVTPPERVADRLGELLHPEAGQLGLTRRLNGTPLGGCVGSFWSKPLDLGGAPPRRGLPQPEHPPGLLRGRSAASTLGSPAARGRHPRCVPRRAPRPGPGAVERVDGDGRGVLPGPPRRPPEPGGDLAAVLRHLRRATTSRPRLRVRRGGPRPRRPRRVPVTVRRSKRKQEGETRDVRVKGGVASRPPDAASRYEPRARGPRRAALAGRWWAAVPGGGPRRRRRARDRPLRPVSGWRRS